MRWAWGLWIGLVTWGPVAQAHTLEVATAQVTLRDGQVAVRAQVDVLGLMQQASVTDDPVGLLAVVDPVAFDVLADETWELLKRQTRLQVDGDVVSTVGWRFPDVAQLRADAQRAWMAQAVEEHVHPTFSELTFEARLVRPPTTVEVALPHAVGPVLIHFVQPVGQLAKPGHAVAIRVPEQSLSLAPPSGAPGLVGAP